MSIERIASLHLDSARLSPSANIPRAAGEDSSSGRSFSQVLESVQEESERENSPRRAVIDRTSKLYEQCEALETFLIKNMLNGMRSTVQKSGFIDEGFAGKMYEDMLYDEYAKNLTINANFGLAEMAYRQLSRF